MPIKRATKVRTDTYQNPNPNLSNVLQSERTPNPNPNLSKVLQSERTPIKSITVRTDTYQKDYSRVLILHDDQLQRFSIVLLSVMVNW